jgi:carbamoyltransferase
MRVLGISGRSRHAAAAIAIDGRIVAGVMEESVTRGAGAGSSASGLPFGAVRAALAHAELSPEHIDLVTFTDAIGEADAEAAAAAARCAWDARDGDAQLRPLAECPHVFVDSLTALAAQALLVSGQSRSPVAVLDLAGGGCAGAFVVDAGRIAAAGTSTGAGDLEGAVARLAHALGCTGDRESALQGIAEGGRADHLAALRDALTFADGRIGVSTPALEAMLAEAAAAAPGPLADPSPVHVKVREARTSLASSLVARLGEIAGDIVAEAGRGEGVIASGSLFEWPAIVSAVQARVGAIRMAPVPGAFGLALGAALAASSDRPASLPSGLAIGPAFSETDVKEVLDGCRLDYVYEPDWPRIHSRASKMLSRGKLVAWFQGAMDFGPRSLGGRSILCDASSRYARENINRYLRHRPDDPAPALVMLASRTAECLADRVSSPFGTVLATVKDEWRLRLQAALDGAGVCRVQTVEPGSSPLAELLAVHETTSGVPALLQVDLRGIGEPTACSPRDAIRTTFSSPVDVLVMERFLLMKDFWLLRSTAD